MYLHNNPFFPAMYSQYLLILIHKSSSLPFLLSTSERNRNTCFVTKTGKKQQLSNGQKYTSPFCYNSLLNLHSKQFREG